MEGKTMAIEYLGLNSVNGPFVVLEGVKGAAYDEIVEIVADGKEKKLGRIVEINEDKAVVQVFEGTDNLSLKNTHTRLTGHPMEIGLTDQLLGRTFNGIGAPIDNLGEVAAEKYADVELEVIPGITAALSGGAVLGAPLMHDFAVISLSDLLTPWETIETRLDAAAKADFSICLYNPSSKKRADYLKRACEIFLRYKSSETVCGIVKNIGRDGEMKKVMTLAELKDYEADMFTTVFIGNSRTEKSVLGGQDWMVTPRGYRI